MKNACWITLVTIGLLWSVCSSAADDSSSSLDNEPLLQSLLIATTLAATRYPSRWQPLYPDTTAFSGNWPHSLADQGFDNPIVFSEAGRVKSLSLLTLAEAGQARLFLGVNRNGLLGVHFQAFSNDSGGRLLEMARLPYLKKASNTAY